MHRFRLFAALVVGSMLSVPALADDVKPQHGGVVSATDAHKFEVVFERSGLKLYPLTKDGKPIDASALSGTATFYHPNSPKPWFSRELGRGPVTTGNRPASLDLPMGLAAVPATGAKVSFRITGLPEPAEPSAEFTTPIRFTARALAPAPVRPAPPPTLSFTASTRADAQAIAAQRVCKVSGESLGSMGAPIKATRGSSTTFLCCRGCIARVKANPDAYLPLSVEPAKGATR